MEQVKRIYKHKVTLLPGPTEDTVYLPIAEEVMSLTDWQIGTTLEMVQGEHEGQFILRKSSRSFNV